ncbi:sortase [Patescibacteria group bacterium]|nr:sortase [Patescibacteria group bacterium]
MAYTKLKAKQLIRHRIHRLTSSEYFRVLILRTLGNFLLLTSIFMIVKTFYLPVSEEVRYFIDSKLQKQYIVAEDKLDVGVQNNIPKGLLAKAFEVKKVEVLTPIDPEFSIVVPKIAANSKVYANTNAANEKEYLDILEKGVAHTLGTAFPGEGGHIFLFAHSTDYFWNVGNYNAVFYLLYKLEKGDEVNLFHKGQRYVYKVIGSEVVDPSEVQYLTRKTNREFLTLQTCWPPGTTLKRLLVFAVRVAE